MAEHGMRVTRHGRKQLELQMTLPISVDLRREDFELDIHVYTPAQLGLTDERYGVRAFLEDMTAFTRQTPLAIPLDKLCDPECAISPFVRLHRALQEAPIGSAVDAGAASYELRTFVNAYHGQLRTSIGMLAGELAGGRDPSAVEPRARALLQEMDQVLAAYRRLYAAAMQPHVPQSLRAECTWADESLSLDTHKQCARLYRVLRRRMETAGVLRELADRIGQEQSYRTRQGYHTVVAEGAPERNDECVYVESMLKKWAQSSMYMSLRPSSRGRKVAQVLAAVAAGAAMAFAVGVTFVAERYLALATFTLPWAILIVGAYAFKDRIKESLRSLLIAAVPRLVADDVMVLVDPRAACRVGWSRLRVLFCSPGDVPEAVDNLRDLKGNPFRAVVPPENVIHVNRRTRIECATIRRHHQRLESITNILRVKLDRWLTGMDDPDENLYYTRDGQVRGVRSRRTYHVNLVARLSRSGRPGERAWYKYRLLLTRDGIVGIEQVETLGKAG